MARDQVLQPLAHAAAAGLGARAVDDHGERVDRLVVDEDAHLDEVAGAVADLVIVETGIAARNALQPVIEIEHHLVERQFIGDLRAAADIGQVLLDAAAVLAQLQDRPQIIVGDIDHRLDPRLLDLLDAVRVGHVGGIVQLHLGRAALLRPRELQLVDHRRRGGDQVEVIFAGQPLLDDLEVEEAQEAAAKAEAQRGARLHLEAERRVVEAQLVDALAQLLEVVGVGREQAAEDDGLGFLEPRQRRRGGTLCIGHRVADARLRDVLDLRGDEADLARADLGEVGALGRETADTVDQMGGTRLHELDLLALFQGAVHHADEDDDAQIGVVPAVDEHRDQRRGGVALWRRDLGDDGFERFLDADPRLGAGQHRVVGGQADDVLDLGLHLVDVGGGQVDLVDDGDDLVVVLDRLIDVGERLCLDPLRRVDDEQRALARGQRPRHFIGEVDVAGGVHQVELIGLAILRGVGQAHRLRLDRDPALFLDVHIIKDLRRHLAFGQPAGELDQPVGERRFPMIDMGDNAEIADMRERSRHRAPLAGESAAVSKEWMPRPARGDFVQSSVKFSLVAHPFPGGSAAPKSRRFPTNQRASRKDATARAV